MLCKKKNLWLVSGLPAWNIQLHMQCNYCIQYSTKRQELSLPNQCKVSLI